MATRKKKIKKNIPKTTKKKKTTKKSTKKNTKVNTTPKKSITKTSNSQKKNTKTTKKTNKLKEYDLKEIKNTTKVKKHNDIFKKSKKIIGIVFEFIVLILSYILYFILLPIKFIINSLCKVFKKRPKKIKKTKIKQYNKNIKEEKVNTINKDKKIKIVKPNIDDELNLLHYDDFKGLNKILVFFQNRIRVILFDMRRFKKKFKYGTLKDKLLIILMILLIIGFSCVVAFCVYIVTHAPDTSASRLYSKNSSILYYKDENGNDVEWARLGLENREKITYDELPDVLVDAIVATEDSRFFQHDGIDIARFTKATIGQLLGQSDAGGGSTLTMQVSKNYFTSKKSNGIEGIIRKFTDIYLSVFVLEKKYTKEEIMEFYVNFAYLGSYSYGVEQAANTYFGKSASELNLVEAATIAGLFQAPYSYDLNLHPVAAEKRRNTVLNLMYRHGYITEEEKNAAQAVPLKSTIIESKASENPYQDYIDTVIEFVMNQTKEMGYGENGLDPTTTPMKIYTTLKPQKQDIVDGVINGTTYKWVNENAQAGIVVTDVKTGAIVAVGASRDPAARVLNFATGINRHPGSTAKPVLDYGPAFEYLNWSTGQTVIDDEMEYTGGYGSVRNFDKKFNGILTAKTALATSRNIPALLTFRQTTNEQKRTFSNALGWHAEDRNGVIYESAAIGGFEGVNPVQASSAYAAFARGGTYITPYIYTKIELIDTGEVIEPVIEKTQAMSEETAYLINNVLMYAVSSGTINSAKFSGAETAAKTGTSTVPQSAKDAAGIKGEIIGNSWLNVYSADYSISTWYGYKNEVDPSAYLTSTEGSNERRKITQVLVKGIMEPGAKFEVPNGIVTAEVELQTDPLELASPYTPEDLRRTEYFKKGTVPETVSKRFDQLSNPSNLKFQTDGTNVTLTWTAAATPDAVNTDYLRNYFTESPIYNTWAEKYLQKRIEYNNNVFGEFGYEVYMVNDGGTIDLGFVTTPSFTAALSVTPSTKFVVKSSYQKFKSNQSSGIYVTASDSSSGTTPSGSNNNYTIAYQGNSCTTASSFKALNPKVKVMLNGTDITSKAAVSQTCKDSEDNTVNCNTMEDGKKYDVIFTVRYNNTNRNKLITISPSC